MKLAAASILTHYKQTAPQGLAIVEAAKNSARNDAEKVSISLALLTGYGSLDEHDKALAVCFRVSKTVSRSRSGLL